MYPGVPAPWSRLIPSPQQLITYVLIRMNLPCLGQCPPDCPSRDPTNYLVLFQHAGFFKVSVAIPDPKFQVPTSSSGSQVVSEDAAVIRLSEPVSNIPPAPLPTSALPTAASTVELVGFGQSYETNSQGTGITQATTDRGLKGAGFVVLGRCNQEFGATGHLCWSSKEPTDIISLCHADSGGPMWQYINSALIIAGINSFAAGPDCPDNPSGSIPNTTSYEDTDVSAPDVQAFLKSAASNVEVGDSAEPADLLTQDTLVDLGPGRKFSTSLSIQSGWTQLVISVNGPVHLFGITQPYHLTVPGPKGQQICTPLGGSTSIPGEASCSISSQQSGTYSISVTGQRGMKAQLVAGGS